MEYAQRKMNKVIFSTKWFDLFEIKNKFNDEKYYGLKPPDYVTAVAYDNEGKINLIYQNRPVIGKIKSLETPGGQVDQGDNPLNAIKKELLEETGFLYKDIKNVAVLEPDVGRLMNKLYIFKADNPKVINQPEDGITLLKVFPEDIISLIKEKKLTNAYSIAALSIVLNIFKNE